MRWWSFSISSSATWQAAPRPIASGEGSVPDLEMIGFLFFEIFK